MKSFPQLQPSIDAWLAAKDPDAQRFAAAVRNRSERVPEELAPGIGQNHRIFGVHETSFEKRKGYRLN